MNKGITLLILFVILGAMGLVMYSHNKNSRPAPQGDGSPVNEPADDARRGGFATPLRAPQGGQSALRQIDPPLGIPLSGTDGAPQPVTLAAGSNAKTEPPAEPPSRQDTARNGGPARPETAPDAGLPPVDAAQDKGNGQMAQQAKPAFSPPPAPSAPPAKAAEPSVPPARAANAADAPLSLTAAHSLQSISLGFAEQGMRLRIEAGDPFPARTFSLSGPDRLVVDLPGVWKGMKVPPVPQNNIVDKVRLGQQPGGPRLVLDLKAPLKNHSVERAGNRVDILVR